MTAFLGRTLATGLGVLAVLYVLVWTTGNMVLLLVAAVLLPLAALIALVVVVRRDDFGESQARAAATLFGLVLATGVTWWAWADFLAAIGD